MVRIVAIALIPTLGMALAGAPDVRIPEIASDVQPGDGKASPSPPAGWAKPRLVAVDKKLDGEIKDLVALYQHLHANPELSLMEIKTASRLAEEMRKVGCDVTEKVGGNGVVAVLKNGPGPVVLVRTDMDALPVTEQTGLAYASRVRMKRSAFPLVRGR